jgi:hypothetical protein
MVIVNESYTLKTLQATLGQANQKLQEKPPKGGWMNKQLGKVD